MRVTIRISKDQEPRAASGLAGALGGTKPGPSTTLEIEADKLISHKEVNRFVEKNLAFAALSVRTAETGEMVGPALPAEQGDDHPNGGTGGISEAVGNIADAILSTRRLNPAEFAMLDNTIRNRKEF